MPYTVGHDLRSGMALVARVLPGNRRSARRRRPPRRLPGEGPEPPVSPQALIRAPKGAETQHRALSPVLYELNERAEQREC